MINESSDYLHDRTKLLAGSYTLRLIHVAVNVVVSVQSGLLKIKYVFFNINTYKKN